jgi:hypothetical protein
VTTTSARVEAAPAPAAPSSAPFVRHVTDADISSFKPLLLAIAIVGCSKVESAHPDPSGAATSIATTTSSSTSIPIAFPPRAERLPEQIGSYVTRFGPAPTRTFAAVAGDTSYMLQWVDYPTAYVAEQTREKIISDVLQRLAGPGVTSIEDSVATNGVDTWHRFVFRDEALRTHDARLTMRGARLYVLMVSGIDLASIHDARSAGFFGSFSAAP